MTIRLTNFCAMELNLMRNFLLSSLDEYHKFSKTAEDSDNSGRRAVRGRDSQSRGRQLGDPGDCCVGSKTPLSINNRWRTLAPDMIEKASDGPDDPSGNFVLDGTHRDDLLDRLNQWQTASRLPASHGLLRFVARPCAPTCITAGAHLAIECATHPPTRHRELEVRPSRTFLRLRRNCSSSSRSPSRGSGPPARPFLLFNASTAG